MRRRMGIVALVAREGATKEAALGAHALTAGMNAQRRSATKPVEEDA